MTVTAKLHSMSTNDGILVPAIAAAMSLPVVMFSWMGYDINPAFLLAPLIGIAFLKESGPASYAYLISMAFGLVSILVTNKISPDGELVKHVFSMMLIMFAPSFLFLGKRVVKSNEIRKVFYWLSLFSSLFLIVVAFRIFYLDQNVRIYIGPLGLAAMNAKFVGLPVFASFGVLSLANLVCLQAMIICGTLISGKISRPMFVVAWIALFCGSFLIIGSDSRSAQIMLVWILGAIILYALRNSETRRDAALAILAIVMAIAVTYARGMDENRLLSSIVAINEPTVVQGNALVDETWKDKADQFATGRVELAIEGVKEAMASPFVGNGFSGYGRYTSEDLAEGLIANTSTHIYYLTLWWKGGLIFFIPFVTFILINLKSAIAGTQMTVKSPERFFAWAAVLMAFGPMAMAWDILIVPSAGAVAFFLFGLLSGLKDRTAAA